MEKQSKYQEIVDWIKQQIDKKELLAGEKIYSEHELASLFTVSRQTVRHAIEVLEQEGLVNRVRGSGTYLTDFRLTTLENKTRIAVVTTYVDSYIFPKTIQGIERVLFEQGYSVQIAFTNNQIERERTILEDIISRDDVGGIIVEATKSGLPNPNLYLYHSLQKRKIPMLFINSYYEQLKAPHVTLDDKYAAAKAVKLLKELGHTKISSIFKLDDGQGRLRYSGFLEAMESSGILPGSTSTIWVDTDEMEQLELSKEKILRRLSGFSAVVCYNDQVARKLISLLKSENIKVPEDISIVSIDDSQLAILGEPKLTSIPHPVDLLGEKAAHNLLKLMKNPSFEADYEFRTEPVIRESVIPYQKNNNNHLSYKEENI